MNQETEKDEVEATRQVGLIADYHVEFGCFVERRRGNKRRIRYEVRINGWPSEASYYVEDDCSRASLGDAEIEAACAHIRKFLRDAITDGIEILQREALHLTHTQGESSDKAFLRDISDYVKEASRQRLESGVAERARKQWLKFEASAKCHQRTALLKEYQSEYRKLYRQYSRSTHQTSHARFVRAVWAEHERKAYADRLPEFLKYAKQVVAGRFTPGEAALRWLSNDMRIPSSSLARRYVRRSSGKRRRKKR